MPVTPESIVPRKPWTIEQSSCGLAVGRAHLRRSARFSALESSDGQAVGGQRS